MGRIPAVPWQMRLVIGGTVGVFLTVAGLAGLPEDLATWANWLDWMKGDAGPWIFTAVGILVLFLTFANRLGFAFGRPARQILSEVQAIPPSEPEQAEEAQLTASTATPEQIAYLEKLKEQQDAAKVEQLRVVFRAVGNPAWQDGVAILFRLSERLREADAIHAYVADLLDSYVLNDRNRERLDTGIKWHDPGIEMLFGDFYEAYVQMGIWIHRVADLLNWSLSEDSEYSRWRERDQRFRSRLRDTCARSEFSNLENLIEAADSLVQ